jgi:hypothetical protein
MGQAPNTAGKRPAPPTRPPKDQLKIQIAPEVHRLLRALCEKSRRTPAGQIEFMTIMFHRHDMERSLPPR